MVSWQVEYTEEFERWWASLTADEQADLDAGVELLATHGPQLGRPHVDTIHGSKHSNMKELRTQSLGKPLRTFFAFDPRRTAILLIGGDKTGDNRFYDRMVPIADRLFDDYLAELKNEGLI